MKQLTPQQIELLNQPLPNEAIKPHPTKKFLSTINAIYVTERLNKVFGVGQWQTRVDEVTSAPGKSNTMVVTKTTFEVPDYGIHIEAYGGNDNADLGDAYKGSMTDALTKIGSYLGIGAHVWKGQPYAQQPAAKPVKQPQPQLQPQPSAVEVELRENIDRFLGNCTSKQDLAMFCDCYGDALKADASLMAKYQERKKQILGEGGQQ